MENFWNSDEWPEILDEWKKHGDKLLEIATLWKKYRNITLVNDYLRFALKIFVYLGGLKGPPSDFQALSKFTVNC